MADYDHAKDCWSRTPHYRPGGKLSAEQLNAGQADAVRRDRIVNVAMHGVGVVFGYQVRTADDGHLVIDDGRIHVGCGLALDRYGRMLFWRGGWVSMHDIIGRKPERAGHYTLRVHYAEKSDRGDAFDPCREGTDWIDRCVAFTLKHGCEPWNRCAPDVPTNACMTRKEWICTRNGFHAGVVPMDEALEGACEDIPTLCASDCGRVSYDPEAGLPLACLEVCDLDRDKHDCDPRLDFCPCTPVDTCTVRPVAYRSRLLHELIDLDDVPRAKIRSYSWSRWWMKCWGDRYQVPFSEFKRRAMACRGNGTFVAAEGLSLMFDRPVNRCTLHPLSVLMEIYLRENRPHYWKPARIPIDVRHLDENGEVLPEGSGEECVWGLVICPLEDWIRYELEDPNSTILDCAHRNQLARIEIILRGQIIRDCCGLMIDARPPDIDWKDPCHDRAGQERIGCEWISIFRIGPDAPHRHGYGDDDRQPPKDGGYPTDPGENYPSQGAKYPGGPDDRHPPQGGGYAAGRGDSYPPPPDEYPRGPDDSDPPKGDGYPAAPGDTHPDKGERYSSKPAGNYMQTGERYPTEPEDTDRPKDEGYSPAPGDAYRPKAERYPTEPDDGDPKGDRRYRRTPYDARSPSNDRRPGGHDPDHDGRNTHPDDAKDPKQPR